MIIFEPAEPDSIVHRRDPRARVAAAAALSLFVCLADRPAVLALAGGAGLALVAAARVPLRRVVRRLGELNLFMALLVVFLPLSLAGEAAFRFHGLTWSRPGLVRAVEIAARANAIMLMVIALVGTLEPAQLGVALHRLGCPARGAHLFLFLVRYLEVVHREYHRLRNAMRLRAFRLGCDRRSLRALGYLLGMLLVHSLDRAERIRQAMKCRGFRGRLYLLEDFRFTRADAAFAALVTVGLAGLVWLEWT